MYSLSSKLQCNTISIVKGSYVRLLWSLYLDILYPNIMAHNYFRVSTTFESFISVVALFICAEVNLRE